MKARYRSILQQLAGHEGYCTVEQIADACGAGVRTIHRDLERIEHMLALKGVRIERQRGRGVRLLDPLPASVLDIQNLGAHQDTHDAADRPFLLLLYLIANPGWCKLSELSHVLFLSDSSVSTALRRLEQYVPDGLVLERQKGVGVRLYGEEYIERLAFPAMFARLFPRYLPDEPDSDGRRLFRALRIGDAAHHILRGIAAAEGVLGYRFAPSYSSMLYSYLFLVRRRVPEIGEIRKLPDFHTDLPAVFHDAAQALERETFANGVAGVMPDRERALLARLLATCEPVESPRTITRDVTGALEGLVERTIERTLAQLEEREGIWLHDDLKLLNYLRLTLAAVTRRLDLFHRRWGTWLPRRHDIIGEDDEEHIDILVHEYRAARSAALADWVVDVDRERDVLLRELQEPYLAIDARLTLRRRRRGAGMTVKVLCYEGLGMSAWLGSIVEGILPPGATVDTRWESVGAGSWDLIIATYPVEVNDTPCLVIDGDGSPEAIRTRIGEAVQAVLRGGSNGQTHVPPSRAAPGLSLSIVMSVVKTFFIAPLSEGENEVERAVAELDHGDCDARRLLADFERRESYGSLVFEDGGFRLLHCRSGGVPEPRAGVLRPPDAIPILVLAAPRTAPPEHTGVLSEIVVAAHDEPGFSHLLAHGEAARVQGALVDLFNRRLV